MQKQQLNIKEYALGQQIWQERKEVVCKLQDLCMEKGDGLRWVNADTLFLKIIKAGDETAVLQAIALYSEYCKLDAKFETLENFANFIVSSD